MNAAHFHLIFNHFPIIVPFVGLLILALGMILKAELVKRTAYGIFILGAVFTIPAFATGEGAEEAVEQIAGVTHGWIHAHEEAAETFALLSYLLGGLSIAALWANWKQKSFAAILSFVVLFFSFVVLFFAQQTGTSGGEIRHTEIRSTQSNAASITTEEVEHKD